MKTKIAMFAAAATLSLAGAAFAQSTAPAAPTNPTQLPPATTSSTTTTTTAPAKATTAAPAMPSATAPAQSTTSSTTTSTTAADADAAGTPSSANVALDLKVGSAVKDPSGAVVGVISGASAGADGSTNVVVTSGEKKFALPKASFSAGADGSLATTATKAQIDATLAGAKPQ
ncbi:hypothetical protein [Caulobacter sp. DWR2-3-1b2]|uniref:hypothetical protein n=1 Tax=unclassified Caulobacter TaxID=2648921 RepID=UPI003CF0D25A